jgi:hypothetical protein
VVRVDIKLGLLKIRVPMLHNQQYSHVLLFMDRPLDFGPMDLLRKAKGCPSYINTAPIPSSLALVSTMKGSTKFGIANTGADIRACFKASYAAE